MNRALCVVVAVGLASSSALAASVKFTSVWKAPGVRQVSFAGKKVAAVVMSHDDSLRVAGEEALTRELTARGLQGVAAYRIIPKEELTVAEKAKGWFERSAVDGVVVLRPVAKEKVQTYNPGTWVTPSYGTLWGYYGYGWGSVYIPGSTRRDTVVVVETTIYSVPRNELVWAGVSETKNPKQLQKFIEDLAKECVKELHKQGLASGIKQ
jgi:hypothetical protein